MAGLNGADGERRQVAVLRVTSAHDGLEHLVAEHTMTVGNAGRYTGLCGRRVWAAVLACPAGPPCLDCIAVRRASEPGARRKRKRQGRWRRLISSLTLPRRRRARHLGKNEECPIPDVTLPLPESPKRRTGHSIHRAGSATELVVPEPLHRNRPR